MSAFTRHERLEATRVQNVRRYLWYAAGEVLLIFAGITLALWFSNSNDERQLREMEVEALGDIAANLRANARRIATNIDTDGATVASCERFADALTRRVPWQDEFAADLNNCRWWTSPYLRSAAYESLKARGTELISDREVRDAVVNLYELEYAYLVHDTDRSIWAFQQAVMYPMLNRYIRAIDIEHSVPNDFASLPDAQEFVNMLHEKNVRHRDSIQAQQVVLEATSEVIRTIDAWLAGANDE